MAYRALALLLVFSGCSSETARPQPAFSAAGLSALDLGELTLLPAAGLPAAPIPIAPPRAAAFATQPRDDRSPARGVSMGSATEGFLLGGRSLPTDHSSLKARPIALRRAAVFGTPGLIAALERAAESVARIVPGSMLWAGDVSARDGGDLKGHKSHNSGRDVDLAFYRRDLAGRPADHASFVVVGADGMAGPGRRFDVPRNWALVRALLTDPDVQVQWIFVATHIKAWLLAYARDRGVDPVIIERASRVMTQPSSGSPHADHFHLRIYCGRAERLEGCVDDRPVHRWVKRWPQDVETLLTGIEPFLDSGPGDEYRYAIDRIVRLGATQMLPRLRRLTASEDPEVALLAAQAVAFLTGAKTPEAWIGWRAGANVGE